MVAAVLGEARWEVAALPWHLAAAAVAAERTVSHWEGGLCAHRDQSRCYGHMAIRTQDGNMSRWCPSRTRGAYLELGWGGSGSRSGLSWARDWGGGGDGGEVNRMHRIADYSVVTGERAEHTHFRRKSRALSAKQSKGPDTTEVGAMDWHTRRLELGTRRNGVGLQKRC